MSVIHIEFKLGQYLLVLLKSRDCNRYRITAFVFFVECFDFSQKSVKRAHLSKIYSYQVIPVVRLRSQINHTWVVQVDYADDWVEAMNLPLRFRVVCSYQ